MHPHHDSDSITLPCHPLNEVFIVLHWLLLEYGGIWAIPLQSPIFGYPWGYPILWISKPWRYPIPEWYDLDTIPSYHGMDATYHSTTYHTIPPHTIPFYLIPYHTIPYHTIPPHTIPSFQTCHRVAGVLFTKYENYFCRLQFWPIGLHLLWTGSSDFYCHFKIQLEAIWLTWSF